MNINLNLIFTVVIVFFSFLSSGYSDVLTNQKEMEKAFDLYSQALSNEECDQSTRAYYKSILAKESNLALLEIQPGAITTPFKSNGWTAIDDPKQRSKFNQDYARKVNYNIKYHNKTRNYLIQKINHIEPVLFCFYKLQAQYNQSLQDKLTATQKDLDSNYAQQSINMQHIEQLQKQNAQLKKQLNEMNKSIKKLTSQ